MYGWQNQAPFVQQGDPGFARRSRAPAAADANRWENFATESPEERDKRRERNKQARDAAALREARRKAAAAATSNAPQTPKNDGTGRDHSSGPVSCA